MTKNEMINKICEDQGMSEIELMENCVLDSVVPGICRECGNVQDCEPDAVNNYCYNCSTNKVMSYTMLVM